MFQNIYFSQFQLGGLKGKLEAYWQEIQVLVPWNINSEKRKWLLKVSKSQKHFSWNSIAQKMNALFDKILP